MMTNLTEAKVGVWTFQVCGWYCFTWRDCWVTTTNAGRAAKHCGIYVRDQDMGSCARWLEQELVTRSQEPGARAKVRNQESEPRLWVGLPGVMQHRDTAGSRQKQGWVDGRNGTGARLGTSRHRSYHSHEQMFWEATKLLLGLRAHLLTLPFNQAM